MEFEFVDGQKQTNSSNEGKDGGGGGNSAHAYEGASWVTNPNEPPPPAASRKRGAEEMDDGPELMDTMSSLRFQVPSSTYCRQ